MARYIWQCPDWPRFRWDSGAILESLGKARQAQGKIIAQADFMGLENQADLYVEEASTTAEIEGEKLDRNTIRSSVARRLGLPNAGLPPEQRPTDGLVEVLMDATADADSPLTKERIYSWHASLFPTSYSGTDRIVVGAWRRDDEPMRVVSGSVGRETVHFEAPPASRVDAEMDRFLEWWRAPTEGLDGLLRAALAHFWFVTIHPFEDGNGRLARALTDLALSQDEKTGRRLYSLSARIAKERSEYYKVLETCQKGDGDVTEWIQWFLNTLAQAIEDSQQIVQTAMSIAKFWQAHSHHDLNDRQIKVIQRMLEAGPEGFEGGMTNKKYIGLTKMSKETAKRDLADLEKRGILERGRQKGRSVNYHLSWWSQ